MNKMKMIPAMILLAMISAMPMIASAQSTAVNGALNLATFSTSPSTAVAGGNVTFTFQLYNSYSENLRNVIMQVSASNPIINVSPGSEQLVQTIPSGTYAGYFTYNFHIPSTLVAGEYVIDIIVSYTTVSGGSTTDVPGQSVIPVDLYVYGTPNVQLTATSVGAINTGGFTTFDISAINTGTDTARNVSISILNSSEFAVSGPTTQNLGIMAPGATAETSVSLLTYANLSQGTDYIPIKVNYVSADGAAYSTTSNVPISYVTGDPNIVATIKSATPSELYAGTNQTVTILVQNIGSGQAKNVTLAFMNGPGINVEGSPSTFFINQLNANASTTESLLISASQNDNKTSYSLPVLVTYQNANHQNNASKLEYLPVTLQGSAVFNITATNSQLSPGGTYQPVVFTIKNTGNEAAQEISISLQTLYPVTPSTPTFYIQSLAPGQSDNATFFVDTDTSGTAGTYPVTLYEQWRQPNGYTTQQYTGSNNYYVIVGGASSGGGGIYYIVAAIVIIVVIVYLIRTKKIDTKAIMARFQKKK